MSIPFQRTGLAPDGPTPSVQDAQGLWQPQWGVPVAERRQTALQAVSDPCMLGQLSLSQYQDWAELDWKEPHGSRPMLDRLSRKFMEEAGDINQSEVLAAHLDVLKNPSSTDAKQHLTDELGDAVWPGSGLLTNCGYDLEDAVKQRLTSQGQPIDMERPLTLNKIDDILAAGFQPLIGVKQSILSQEDRQTADYMNAKVCWPLIATMLKDLAAMQYQYPPQYLHDLPDYISLLGRYAADSVLFAGYMAHNRANGTLKDVIANNISKVSHRVTTNTIDKSDGIRTP